jgi:hypothetical protein
MINPYERVQMGLYTRFKSSWLYPFQNSGGTSTLASPSSELVNALVGMPAAAGKIVTRETAIRVAAFLGGVKMLSNDLAKMPLILRQTKTVSGRQRTLPAVDETLYTGLPQPVADKLSDALVPRQPVGHEQQLLLPENH